MIKYPATIQDRSYSSLLLILAGSFLLSLLYCPPVDVFFDDKEIFKYTGMVIAKGGVPYRDFFDHKPPLIFFMNYFGLLLGPWGLWLIDTLLVMIAASMFTRTCLQYRLPFPWLLPLLFILLIRNYLVCRGIGMTRSYTAVFLLIFFCILMGKHRYKYFSLGILSALIFFMQQDQILALLPFLAFALLDHFPSDLWQRSLRIAAGFVAVTAIILLYFGWHHALDFFWEDAFVFNFSWYSQKKPFIDLFRTIRSGLANSSLEMPLILSVTLAIGALLWGSKKKGLIAAALLSVGLSFAPELLSGRLDGSDSFYYYFLPLSATLPILVFTVFAFTEATFVRDNKSQALYGFLLCFLLFYNALQHGTHLSRHNNDIVKARPEYAFLAQQPLRDYQLYIFGDNNWVYAYNQFHILSPSRWIYHHFWVWFDRWDADNSILRSIENDLLRHHTIYIIDYSALGTYRPATLASWTTFLHRYYEPVTLPQPTSAASSPAASGVLWQLRSNPAPIQ